MTTSFLFNNKGGPTASFPSGHTAVAFSIITPYAQIYHQPWLYTIPFAVGISRILAQDGHWASDVAEWLGTSFTGNTLLCQHRDGKATTGELHRKVTAK
jgi:membrane-associated phospholipid phosphatase